ncbi:hypothetical protein C8J56DRAFT_1158430 [Mycena floridula]|nr:hypothetical protein C8J56DRAFT_1158430 [Mycena floridula]
MSADCTADIQSFLHGTGETIMTAALPLIVQAIFWTLYLVSVVLTLCVLWWQGFNRARTILLVLIVLMFVMDTLAFSLDLYSFFFYTREILLLQDHGGNRFEKSLATAKIVQNVVSLFMLIPGDCIVIWRAHTIWARSRIVMIIPTLFLVGCLVNLPIFVFCNIKHNVILSDIFGPIGPVACFATDLSAWILSICTNFSATLMIFYAAWSYYASQRRLQEPGTLHQRSKVARVLLLLVESGFAYFLVMIFWMTLALLPTPAYYGPSLVLIIIVDNILTPHCIAMVPTLTILLVALYGSFEEYSIGTLSQPIQFVSPRVTMLSHVSAVSRPVRRESDAEATNSHNPGPGQETNM